MSGTLKLDLAQFRELEAFATFGSELDAVSKAQLERGYRLVELLKQACNAPMPVEEQVVSIFAGTNGYLDDIPVADVRRFEAELLEYVRSPPRPTCSTASARPGDAARRARATRSPTSSDRSSTGGQRARPSRDRRRRSRRRPSDETLETQ